MNSEKISGRGIRFSMCLVDCTKFSEIVIFLVEMLEIIKLISLIRVTYTYHTIALISHAGKVMLKILQARPQQYMNHELPAVQAGFRKGRGTRDQIANVH